MDTTIEFLALAGVDIPFLYLHYSKVAFLLIAIFVAVVAFEWFVCTDSTFAMTCLAAAILAGGYGLALNAYARNVVFEGAETKKIVGLAQTTDGLIVKELRQAFRMTGHLTLGDLEASLRLANDPGVKSLLEGKVRAEAERAAYFDKNFLGTNPS